MSKRFFGEWLAVTLAVGIMVPALMLLATDLRMAMVGDKPATTGENLARIEQIQWGVQLSIYVAGIAALTFFILLFIKRK